MAWCDDDGVDTWLTAGIRAVLRANGGRKFGRKCGRRRPTVSAGNGPKSPRFATFVGPNVRELDSLLKLRTYLLFQMVRFSLWLRVLRFRPIAPW